MSIDTPSNGTTDAADVAVTFVGTATVLIRSCGFTILTDPNFLHRGERAYVGLGVSTRRLTEPALALEQLPPLDLVVLSHHHGDHFDQRAAAGLDKDLPIVTEPHAAAKLRSQGFRRPIALRTWQSQAFERGDAGLTVTAVPARHAPAPLDRLVPPAMGSVIDFSKAGRPAARLYVTGDTLLDDRLTEIPSRYPGIDLCLIHLGGTRIAGVLLTMDAAQGTAALRLIAPRVAIPVHFDDYSLFRSPLSDFKAAVEADPPGTEIVYLARGETHVVPADRFVHRR